MSSINNKDLTPKEIQEINDFLADTLYGGNFQDFSVGEKIAIGGQAKVYSLVSPDQKQEYVIKVLYSKDGYDEIKSRFDKINKVCAEISGLGYSNSICAIERHFITPVNQLHCLIEKRRICLSEYIKNNKDVDYLEIAIRICSDLLGMFHDCLQKGILHRDIKIDNLFLKGETISEGLLLGDFGTATHIHKKNLMTTQKIRGTLPTIAPEWVALGLTVGSHNSVNFDKNTLEKFIDITKSDMYSIAATVYFFLNDGEYPFDDTYIRFVNHDKRCRAPKNGTTALKRIIVKALSYYPQDRFSSCQAMLKAIKTTQEYKKYIIGESRDSEKNVTDKKSDWENFIEPIIRYKQKKRIITISAVSVAVLVLATVFGVCFRFILPSINEPTNGTTTYEDSATPVTDMFSDNITSSTVSAQAQSSADQSENIITNANPSDTNPTEAKPTEINPTEAKPTETKPSVNNSSSSTTTTTTASAPPSEKPSETLTKYIKLTGKTEESMLTDQNAVFTVKTSSNATSVKLEDYINGGSLDGPFYMHRVDDNTWIFSANVHKMGQHRLVATAIFDDGTTMTDTLQFTYPFS